MEKKLTPIQTAIERIGKLSTAPGDNNTSAGFHEGIQWAVTILKSLFPSERSLLKEVWEASKNYEYQRLGPTTPTTPDFNQFISTYNTEVQ